MFSEGEAEGWCYWRYSLSLLSLGSRNYNHWVAGAMAQLVARVVRNDKVAGSIPASSTE